MSHGDQSGLTGVNPFNGLARQRLMQRSWQLWLRLVQQVVCNIHHTAFTGCQTLSATASNCHPNLCVADGGARCQYHEASLRAELQSVNSALNHSSNFLFDQEHTFFCNIRPSLLLTLLLLYYYFFFPTVLPFLTHTCLSCSILLICISASADLASSSESCLWASLDPKLLAS